MLAIYSDVTLVAGSTRSTQRIVSQPCGVFRDRVLNLEGARFITCARNGPRGFARLIAWSRYEFGVVVRFTKYWLYELEGSSTPTCARTIKLEGRLGPTVEYKAHLAELARAAWLLQRCSAVPFAERTNSIGHCEAGIVARLQSEQMKPHDMLLLIFV